ncbi:beta-ketoacyl synthase-like protein [Ulvibacter sp. MAR_2010_11]|uniref:beta-ketoacyl synthase chain length factor n=1 Tax=Ulvibacter sp. MAR_2010_11 TaxID=1250229 RepID=UPI000C2BCBD7|nr:beta-ketoacyl synthase chain length factor [Ulvibacter sp. MAR_2010_11]PKA83228.1 beta-ketoacyl synthase-like protein [Ulvibacter sp. MAR_2010_11]
MKKCYIHSAAAISAQNTFDTDEFLDKISTVATPKTAAQHPNYKDYISPVASRRMATGVKMGVAAATKVLQTAGIEQPDAILTGTGMGCIEDTEKFLNGIIEHDETFLTPTAFIQSTHNTMGAQIALGLQCKAYNSTYVHGALSFESALLDASLLLECGEANTVLVGGVDELGNEFVDYVQMLESQQNKGITVPFGEGATFFAVSSERKPQAVCLTDIESISTASVEKVKERFEAFLKQNSLEANQVDAVILGVNGDSFDEYYEAVCTSFFSETKQIQYKQLSGEYHTASAFGLWLGCEIIRRQEIPQAVVRNFSDGKRLKNIVLYNQFKGANHSFILLEGC